ncbi:MAG: cell division protein FtsQ/DivIB [Kofleriaceae bacterium]
MDRSRRGGTKSTRASSEPPAASRLTVRARAKGARGNRRRQGSLWARMPKPGVVVDACGRAVRRSMPGIAAVAAIATIGTGVWLGYRFLTTDARFAIVEIRIDGEHHLTEDQIRDALPVKVGDNVFASNLDTVTNKLRATPWIASAFARRVLPDTLVIEIREHAPAAIVDLGALYLVDPTGHPFKRAQLDHGDGDGLPVITGFSRTVYELDPAGTAETITAALAALHAWTRDPARPAIGELYIDAHRVLTLRTYDHATAIQLGPLSGAASLTRIASRMATFDAVWADLSDAERERARALHLDARADQVTIALHAPEKKD